MLRHSQVFPAPDSAPMKATPSGKTFSIRKRMSPSGSSSTVWNFLRQSTGSAKTFAPLVMMLRAIEPKTGKVFDDTNLRVEWQKACAGCGQGTRTLVEPEDEDGWP